MRGRLLRITPSGSPFNKFLLFGYGKNVWLQWGTTLMITLPYMVKRWPWCAQPNHEPFKNSFLQLLVEEVREIQVTKGIWCRSRSSWLRWEERCGRVASRSWRQLLADRQQGHRHVSLPTSRNWILPTTQMSLEVNSFPEPPEVSLNHPIPWCWPCETLLRDPAPAHPNFWARELRARKWGLFQAACWSSLTERCSCETELWPSECDRGDICPS